MTVGGVLIAIAALALIGERCPITRSRTHTCAACWVVRFLVVVAAAVQPERAVPVVVEVIQGTRRSEVKFQESKAQAANTEDRK